MAELLCSVGWIPDRLTHVVTGHLVEWEYRRMISVMG